MKKLILLAAVALTPMFAVAEVSSTNAEATSAVVDVAAISASAAPADSNAVSPTEMISTVRDGASYAAASDSARTAGTVVADDVMFESGGTISADNNAEDNMAAYVGTAAQPGATVDSTLLLY